MRFDEQLDEARRAVVSGEPQAARELCDAVLRALPRSREAPSIAAEALRIVARAHLVEGHSDVALECLEAAYAIGEADGNLADTGYSLNGTGVVHMGQGQLDDAERCYGAALRCAEAAGDAELRRRATQNLGIIANIRGDLREALVHYRRSLADHRESGQASNVAATLNNLGMVHVDLGQWGQAEQAYAEALEIVRGIGDLNALALLYVNVAEMWIGRGDPERARVACDAAMEVCRRTAHAPAIGEAHKICGVVAREQGAYAEAEGCLDRAAETAESRADLLLLAETSREQAELYRRQGRNADTLRALNRAYKLFDGLRARRDLADIGRRVGRIEDEFLEVARRWGESIEAKDRYTQGHCKRVADLACLIAVEAGFDEQSIFWFRIGALLHDVGKLVIPEAVLNKPGKLTDDEWSLMRSHTAAGVEMLAGIDFPWDVRPIVRSHHERWDGRGYPDGLAGEEIPLVARILCIADVYDALTSVRSYKRAMSHDDAMSILRGDAGTAFDPTVFAYFERIADGRAPHTAAMQQAAAAERDAGPDAVPLPAGHDPVTRLPLVPILAAQADRLLSPGDGSLARPVAVLHVCVDGDALRTRSDVTFDALSRRIADALSRNTRGGDLVGRLDEERYLVLLADAHPAEARAAADRLRDAVTSALLGPNDATIPLLTREARPRVAIGIAAAPGHGRTTEALLLAARIAADELAAPRHRTDAAA